MKIVVCFVLVLSLLLTGKDYALAMTVSLREAVGIALKDNPLLKAYTWKIAAQKEERNITKGHLYPKFTLEERFSRTDNPTYAFMAKLNQARFTQEDFAINALNSPSPVTDFQTTFSFEMPLYAPRVRLGIELTSGELAAKEEEYTGKREETALEVVKAYLMVQTAKGYVRVARSAIEDAGEHRRLAGLRFNSGLGLYADVLRADVALKDAERLLVKAESNLEIAKRALGLLLGLTEPVDVTDDSPSLELKDVTAFMEASKEKGELKAMEKRYANALKAVKLQKAALLPVIGLGGSYRINDHRRPLEAEGESYTLMAFLRWNIFDPTVPFRIKKAEAQAGELREHLSGLTKETAFRIHKAYSRVKEREKDLELSRAALRKVREAQRLVRLRYENSLTPIVDLLDTQTMLDRARAGLVQAEKELGAQTAELYYQSGLLVKTILPGNEYTKHKEEIK